MVELVNNHVLFPEAANWSLAPQWERNWQDDLSSGLTGAESRLAVRKEPRAALTFLITPAGIVAQARFDDRVRAAKKSGLACAPLHGRGYVLQGSVVADTAVLDRPWQAALGDYLFFATAAGQYEVRQVVAAEEDTVTLDQAVARAYPANTFCWPLIFGKFTAETMRAASPALGELQITIAELVSPASAQLGEVTTPAGDGIGIMTVAGTLEVQ